MGRLLHVSPGRVHVIRAIAPFPCPFPHRQKLNKFAGLRLRSRKPYLVRTALRHVIGAALSTAVPNLRLRPISGWWRAGSRAAQTGELRHASTAASARFTRTRLQCRLTRTISSRTWRRWFATAGPAHAAQAAQNGRDWFWRTTAAHRRPLSCRTRDAGRRYAPLRCRQRRPAIPARPRPSSVSEAGSGTGGTVCAV